MKKHVYFVGNAHLDSVWMWQWQEGSAEAKATVRSALDRMKEYPEFKFVCSSAVLYQWIETFSPDMFEEIRQRVKEGRWIIVGGWHVQPDCNNPSGEGFARQSLYAQRYFYDRFGKTAEIGYNVDSFGHNASMPQILQKSGMKGYYFMRPMPHEMDLPSSIFRWHSPDGSSVMVYRIFDRYCFDAQDLPALEEFVEQASEAAHTDVDGVSIFYGVGNHGGGPTKQNLNIIREFAIKHPDFEVVYSDCKDFLDMCESFKGHIPDVKGELQHHASGCYAAVSEVKNQIRKGENILYSAEALSSLSSSLLGSRVPTQEIRDAWKQICFAHFHDSMGGCCIRPVYDDVFAMTGEARNKGSKIVNDAVQTLSWAVDTSRVKNGLPVVIFNPHPWTVRQSVTVNKQADTVRDAKGRKVRCQQVFSPTASCYHRNDVMFVAEVPAFGYTTYVIEDTGRHDPIPENRKVGRAVLENDFLRVTFDPATGTVSEMLDKQTSRNWIGGPGGQGIVIDETDHDTWSHGKNSFDNVVGQFKKVKMEWTEKGPVRQTLKITYRYGSSTMAQYYSLLSDEKVMRVRVKLDWQEKHKMLKIAYPVDITDPQALYEIPFGMVERPMDGEEEPGLMWTGLRGKEGFFGMLNTNRYSFSAKDKTMYLTAVRSPIYGDHGAGRFSESEYTDLGACELSYAVCPDCSPKQASRLAREWNMPLQHVIENAHEGKLPRTYSGFEIDSDHVVLSAFKRSEDQKGWIIRFFETIGEPTDVSLSGPCLRQPIRTTVKPFEVKTMYLADEGSEWNEVLMTEFACE